jgi:hypothetical protein
VYYGSTCSTLVPDGTLSGNSTGFQASASPLNLSGISTTTYNQLCLKATLTSTNQSVPTLNDWTISWERQPYLTQSHYRWYANANVITPTDPWPSGATDLNEDSAISSDSSVIYGAVVRLRMSILDSNVALSSSAAAFTLQYAEGATCSTDMSWHPVGLMSSTTAEWRGYNNASVSDGGTISSLVLSNSDVGGSYEEENDSANNPNTISTTQDAEWDWVLQHNGVAGTTYCFRVIKSDGETLNAYSVYPQLVTNDKPSAPQLEKLFDNEMVASTTPWFEFASDDPSGDDLTYEVQIDDTHDFSSTVLDRNSQTNFTEFSNIVTPADKDPFNSGQTIRFIPTTALTNNTTYYWRVRAKDRNHSQEWSDWSDVYSFTINTGTTITTWHQTTFDQFNGDSHQRMKSYLLHRSPQVQPRDRRLILTGFLLETHGVH